MFSGLHDIDWSSMVHAYGSAEEVPGLLLALRSSDEEERDRALSRFYGAVHHQGDVYACTVASLPFLFELADDTATPGRDDVVELLVSIGSEAVGRGDVEYVGHIDFAGAARVVRGRAETFVGFACDPDVRVRRAAVPGLGLFVDDVARASEVLRGRMADEPSFVVQSLIVEAMANLALRLPEHAEEATAWFAALAADPHAVPETRLAAVVQRARCAPGQVDEGTVAAAIELLREADVGGAEEAWGSPPRPAVPGDGPPQIVAAFEDLERHRSVHSPTTDLLRTFHGTLAERVPARTTLLAEQLRSRDPGARLDAIRMSRELMAGWRGDHARLVMLVAEHLGASHPQVAAEAAAALNSCHAIAEPAREALAAYVGGPDGWCSARPHVRRGHQEAVQALARLGDVRAVPSLVAALDGGEDGWRAVQVAGRLPQAAERLVPLVCDHLRSLDLAHYAVDMSARSALSALVGLADGAVEAIAETLDAAVARELWSIASSALDALAAFGPSAAPALRTIRPLIAHGAARPAAVAALWAIGGDPDEVVRPALGLLDDRAVGIGKATDVLAGIGPHAREALPRLRDLLADGDEWNRVSCANALWEIGGVPEAPVVLDTLLQAWGQNPFTANEVVACLERMGDAAVPAVPQLRAELLRPERRGRFGSIDDDEELQRICRVLIEQLV
ncbi:hypothetical protein [Actinomadura rifamycini]|uniref:hypothetical protein n=1 Tax=Actinomadura rifamycini TaxID=31962 RepID=UPI00047A4C1A|nr:hypothetical protein [Actinomadura rifamycini]